MLGHCLMSLYFMNPFSLLYGGKKRCSPYHHQLDARTGVWRLGYPYPSIRAVQSLRASGRPC